MMNTENYVVKSLELHLFFCRIMKEHALFLRAGFTPANPTLSEQAEYYLAEFEKLLRRAVELGDGVVSREVLRCGEVVTEYTSMAEKQTEGLTGIGIDKEITAMTHRMRSGCRKCASGSERSRRVKALNRDAMKLLDGLICFKETVLQKVLCCEVFTLNYPLLIEHIIREAKLYREYLDALEKTGDLPKETMLRVETFWNQIMMEHAMFIRGLLDPCEEELFDAADDFAQDYGELLERCRNAQDEALTAQSLEETCKFRDFKASGTKGIQQCRIRSVILPLLADHVLREANHYIRLLKE